MKDGEEVPVAFASRTLTLAERNYSVGEKEALSCVWACEKWFQYVWGRHFVLRTDHQALNTLLSSKGSGRQSMRIARWATRLLRFNYTVEYLPGLRNYAADALSRLPPGGVFSHDKCATHPCSNTSEMDPKWRITAHQICTRKCRHTCKT